MIKFLLLFFIFFPYVNPVETPWSLQPFALLFSIIYLIIRKNDKINKIVLILFFVGVVSIFFSILSFNNLVNSLRSIANYVSLPLIVWAVYVLNPTDSIVIKFVRISALVYFFVGFIQMYFYSEFLTFLVPHQENTEVLLLSGRGVSSLAPEPSYFGFVLLLYFYFSLLTRDKLLLLISVVGIVFLAQSFSVIFCLIISIFILISFKSLHHFFLSFFTLFLILYLAFYFIDFFNSDTRTLFLVQSLINNGLDSFIDNDASASGRLFHIIYPISQSFSNFFLPFGYNGLPNGDTRILSGIGGAIYELGFFSFVIFISIFNILFFKNNYEFNVVISVGIGLFLFILNANQLGMPIFCFVLSYILFQRKINFKNEL